MDYPELRQGLVDYLTDNGYLNCPRVKDALLRVPRHCFAGIAPEEAYIDQAIRLKETKLEVVSTISQPSIVAHMLEQLKVYRGTKVLEIGAGSGYNAALLSHLVGPEGSVVTIEYDQELAEKAKENLKTYSNVSVVYGDGRSGYVSAAPFERIIATVRANDIYPQWQKQVAQQGLMLIPLEYAPGFTRLLKLTREETEFRGRFDWAVNFVPMAGESSTEDVESGELLRLLRRTGLSRHQWDSLIFFYLCSGQDPQTAFAEWMKLGSPKPGSFSIRTSLGQFSLKFPSITLGLSLPENLD